MKKASKTPLVTPSVYYPQSVPNPLKGEVNPSTGLQTSMITTGADGRPVLDPFSAKNVMSTPGNEEMK